MFTPYDWQEGIGHRAQYIQAKLAQGAPVIAVSIPAGILVFTYRRQSRKVYEIYDRIIFAGIGQQSDVEAVRIAALEFASKEGFSRSEEDVTVQRVATAMSAPLKKAFSDFSSSPIVAKCLFAEVNESPETDLYYTIDYDGDFSTSRRSALIDGGQALADLDLTSLDSIYSMSPEDALKAVQEKWIELTKEGDSSTESDSLKGMRPEAVLLERSNLRDNRFRLLTPEEL